MLVNQNRVLLVIIAVIVGCLVNMPQLKLKDPRKKLAVFAGVLYLAYWFLNSQGLVEGVDNDGTDDHGLLPSADDESVWDNDVDGGDRADENANAFAPPGPVSGHGDATYTSDWAKGKAENQGNSQAYKDAQKAIANQKEDWEKDAEGRLNEAAVRMKNQRKYCDPAGFSKAAENYVISRGGNTTSWAAKRAACKTDGNGPFDAEDWKQATLMSLPRDGRYYKTIQRYNKAQKTINNKHCGAPSRSTACDKIIRCLNPFDNIGKEGCYIPKCAQTLPYTCK